MTDRARATAGFTLIEVLIAVVLLSLVMGTAYASLISQIHRHAGQMMVAEALHAARLAFNEMTAEIGNAGFGVPVPTTPSTAASIVVAEPTRVQFWADVGTVHTFLTAAASKDSRAITVLSTAGIKADASLYVVDTSHWFLGSVDSVSSTTVRLTSALPRAFAAGALVTPVELVTYELVDGALVRNGHVFIPNVTNLQFTYDSTTLAQIHLITVSMTVQARASDPAGGARRTVTLAARLAPPNLVL